MTCNSLGDMLLRRQEGAGRCGAARGGGRVQAEGGEGPAGRAGGAAGG